MQADATVWVAEGATATATGTRDQPFATPWRALEWLAERRSQGDLQCLTVMIGPGLYRMERPVLLSSRECPAGSCTVIRSADEARPCLSGAMPRSAHVLDAIPLHFSMPDSRGMLAIDLPQHGCSMLDLGDIGYARPVPLAPPSVTIAGRRLKWARWPLSRRLTGVVVDVKALGGGPEGYDALAIAIDDTDDVIPVQDPGLWIEMVVDKPWCWFQGRVIAADRNRRIVMTSLPAGTGRAGQLVSDICFVNAVAGLTPQTAVLDGANRQMLTVNDRDSATSASDLEIEVTNNESAIFHIAGAHSVTLDGLAMCDTSGSGVFGQSCRGVTIKNCSFARIGTEAIALTGYDLKVVNCHVEDVGTTGIRIDSGDISTLDSGRSCIEGCSVSDWATWNRVYEPAIRARGVGIVISDCVIENGPHIAVDLSGNDHLLRGCVIGNVVRNFDDMGAVYVNQGETPLRRGLTIVGNYFHNIGGLGDLRHAVYIDRASCGVLIKSNIFRRIGGEHSSESCAIYTNGTSDVAIVDNVFADCAQPISINFYLAGWGVIDLPQMQAAWAAARAVLTNPDAPHHTRYPELALFSLEDRIRPRSNVTAGNLVLDPSGKLTADDTVTVNYAPRDLVRIADNRIFGRGEQLGTPTVGVAQLLAGLDLASALAALDHALTGWPLRARSLGLFE